MKKAISSEQSAQPAGLTKWNRRHSAMHDEPRACYLLRQYLHLIPMHGDAADVACGRGSNGLALAKHGLITTAWDYSPVALQGLKERANSLALPVTCELVDLESLQQVDKPHFDVVVVSHYLHRPLCPLLEQLIRPGGWLLYQTFLACAEPASGPSNPRFRLQPGELPGLFDGLAPVHYQELGRESHPSGLTNMVFFVARKHP